MKTQRPLPRRLLVTLAVVAGSAGLAAGVTSAAPPVSAAPPSTVAEPAPVDPGTGVDDTVCDETIVSPEADEFDQLFSELGETEKSALIEQMTADAAAQKAALDAAGIGYELVVDPTTGVEFPSVAPEDTQAQELLLGLEPTAIIGFDIDIDDAAIVTEDVAFDISVEGSADYSADFDSLDDTQKADVVAEMSQFAQDLAAELDAAGVGYTMEADPVTGVEWPMPTDGDLSGLEGSSSWIEIGDEDCLAGDIEVITEEVSDAEFEEFINSLSPEERTELVNQMTADAAELKQQLDEAGVAYTLEVDPITGVEWPCTGETESDETYEYEVTGTVGGDVSEAPAAGQ